MKSASLSGAFFLFADVGRVPARVVQNEEATQFRPGPASLKIRRCGGPDLKAFTWRWNRNRFATGPHFFAVICLAQGAGKCCGTARWCWQAPSLWK